MLALKNNKILNPLSKDNEDIFFDHLVQSIFNVG